MTMIRGAIFDLDGTLGDTLPICYKAFGRVLRSRLGREFGNEEIHAMFGPSEEGVLGRLFPDDPQAALSEYLYAYREAHAVCTVPFEGMRGVLDLLRRHGVELGLVTGKGPGSARISLDALGLGGFFPLVETGSPHGGIKPACMLRILNCWQFPAREVIGVGDSPSDVRSARQAGIVSVAAAWAPTAVPSSLAACQPDHMFRHVPAFRCWLEAAVSGLTE